MMTSFIPATGFTQSSSRLKSRLFCFVVLFFVLFIYFCCASKSINILPVNTEQIGVDIVSADLTALNVLKYRFLEEVKCFCNELNNVWIFLLHT